MSPATPRAEFAFHGLSPNPSRGPLRMEYSLPDFGPASVEVLDITGRRVAERALGSPGPGRHTFELREALPPGVYMVRLVHASRTRFMKAVIIR